jgi:hypothetical protein
VKYIINGRKNNPFIGKWEITEMEHWAKREIDLEGTGYFSFKKERTGEFAFIAVQGQLDYEIEEVDSRPRLEFSWEGNDEMDAATGRGWARVEDDGSMFGKLAFHMGDKSWFKAKRMERAKL